MMGDGVGFIPEKGEIVAPFDGTVKTIFPTKHAIGLESESGVSTYSYWYRYSETEW